LGLVLVGHKSFTRGLQAVKADATRQSVAAVR
jgi:hypothetical protein